VDRQESGRAWGSATYGNPCRECGHNWDISREAALREVASIQDAFRAVIGTSDADQIHPDLSWSAKGYVLHVGDNLRIWAERLETRMAGGPELVATYDDNLLAAARNYEKLPLATAWVTLEWSVKEWLEAVERALVRQPQLLHPERGWLSVEDVIATNCHDVSHHLWDVRRTLNGGGSSGDA
jgi:hypothetical protein